MSAVCERCERDMLPSCSCAPGRAAIPYGAETHMRAADSECHDCGAPLGGFHHTRCDVEQCPVCGGQMLSCPHLDTTDPLARL